MVRVDIGTAAAEFHRDWIAAREERLARRHNFSTCAFRWGLEALEGVPGFRLLPGHSELEIFRAANKRWLRDSEAFFAYRTPSDFALQGADLRFSSPVQSPYRENDAVHATYFPSSRAHGRTVLVLHHWNAQPGAYFNFCKILNLLGFSALLVTLPYHGKRKPAQCTDAEYAVSPNVGLTIASGRQGVIDTLACVDWLESQGYSRFAIAGTSLGFGFSFMVSAHDPRLRVNVFNHCCSTVSDAVRAGMPGLRAAFEPHISQAELRECWSVINPISYFDRFARLPKKSLLIRASYDTTFAAPYVAEMMRPFAASGLDHHVVELPCGHHTVGELPYAAMDAYHICAFISKYL